LLPGDILGGVDLSFPRTGIRISACDRLFCNLLVADENPPARSPGRKSACPLEAMAEDSGHHRGKSYDLETSVYRDRRRKTAGFRRHVSRCSESQLDSVYFAWKMNYRILPVKSTCFVEHSII